MRVRRALIHPSCNLGYPWKNPSTLDEWRQDPSRKIDLLTEILQWHLASDGQPPLMVVDDKLVPSKTQHKNLANAATKGAPDKIVVYCEFPSAFIQIKQVRNSLSLPCYHSPYCQILKLHNIQTLELHGDVPITQRPEVTRRFVSATQDGPRVLLMTTVGLVGLNLPCSNILVKLVGVYCLFSSILYTYSCRPKIGRHKMMSSLSDASIATHSPRLCMFTVLLQMTHKMSS